MTEHPEETRRRLVRTVRWWQVPSLTAAAVGAALFLLTGDALWAVLAVAVCASTASDERVVSRIRTVPAHLLPEVGAALTYRRRRRR